MQNGAGGGEIVFCFLVVCGGYLGVSFFACVYLLGYLGVRTRFCLFVCLFAFFPFFFFFFSTNCSMNNISICYLRLSSVTMTVRTVTVIT